MNIEWDAGRYGADFGFVAQYGQAVAALIDAPAGSRVVDLGCGNGTLTAQLAERGYRVTGIDASPELLEQARKHYPGLAFAEADATDFRLAEPVDVVFSNAVFHWIDDNRQDDLLRCVCAALRPGGMLVCEFGGYGNNALIHAALRDAFARHGREYVMPFYFPTIGEYAPRLERSGLCVCFARLYDRMTELVGDDGLADWIRMFVKHPFVGIGVEETDDIIRQAVAQLKDRLFRAGKWYADYVRIQFKAVKV
ncbi:MAG: class I SAM-dependent methyltransferase [Bacteroidaceae bacterium]|jgi:trans-aconitate methyltransferase